MPFTSMAIGYRGNQEFLCINVVYQQHFKFCTIEQRSNEMISEPDWENFKRIRQIALDRYCTAILKDAERTCVSDNGKVHDRYLELYALIQKHNKDMKFPFVGLSRNKAPVQINVMYDMGLVTDEEMRGLQRVHKQHRYGQAQSDVR